MRNQAKQQQQQSTKSMTAKTMTQYPSPQNSSSSVYGGCEGGWHTAKSYCVGKLQSVSEGGCGGEGSEGGDGGGGGGDGAGGGGAGGGGGGRGGGGGGRGIEGERQCGGMITVGVWHRIGPQ